MIARLMFGNLNMEIDSDEETITLCLAYEDEGQQEICVPLNVDEADVLIAILQQNQKKIRAISSH